MIPRRSFLQQSVASALGMLSMARPSALLAQGADYAARPPLVPILARPDRIFRVTVCIRPFRAAGPHIAAEAIAGKHVVHHYGHGGSGWSLSWGSAQEAVPLAFARVTRPDPEIAVIGAGAIGLTTAITAQRMGGKVTIYAKERFPQTRSASATGGWTPNSRIAMEGSTAPDLADRWERMARKSFATHQSYLGIAGTPVEWTDRYLLSDSPLPEPADEATAMANGPSCHFTEFDKRLADLTPHPELLPPGTHPFAAPVVQRTMTLTFNIADLCRQLESEFMQSGGRFVPMDLRTPADLARLREPVVINCTGYGARALFDDQSVIPVRGQIAWLIPQEGINYGVRYRERGLSIVGRRDGIVVQPIGQNDFYGFDNANEAPDLTAARADVELAASFLGGPAREQP